VKHPLLSGPFNYRGRRSRTLHFSRDEPNFETCMWTFYTALIAMVQFPDYHGYYCTLDIYPQLQINRNIDYLHILFNNIIANVVTDI
jgi:hypothetical protein